MSGETHVAWPLTHFRVLPNEARKLRIREDDIYAIIENILDLNMRVRHDF